jgi:hypothetical protein
MPENDYTEVRIFHPGLKRFSTQPHTAVPQLAQAGWRLVAEGDTAEDGETPAGEPATISAADAERLAAEPDEPPAATADGGGDTAKSARAPRPATGRAAGQDKEQ